MATLGLLFYLLAIILGLILAAIPAAMAKRLGRSYTTWFILGFLFSWVLAGIALAFLGETDNKRKERIREDEEIRQSVRLRFQQKEMEHVRSEVKKKDVIHTKTLNDLYKRE